MERGTEEEGYYREKHLDNNTFSEGENGERRSAWDLREREKEDGGRGIFIEGEEVRVVVVKIRDGRVADWKGAVRDWSLVGGEMDAGREEALVNGVGSA